MGPASKRTGGCEPELGKSLMVKFQEQCKTAYKWVRLARVTWEHAWLHTGCYIILS